MARGDRARRYLVEVRDRREERLFIVRSVELAAGGKFYAANNEEALLSAIADLDKVATGTIATRQYTSQRPRFAFFALAAAACWLTAAALKLALPQFQKLP